MLPPSILRGIVGREILRRCASQHDSEGENLGMTEDDPQRDGEEERVNQKGEARMIGGSRER